MHNQIQESPPLTPSNGCKTNQMFFPTIYNPKIYNYKIGKAGISRQELTSPIFWWQNTKIGGGRGRRKYVAAAQSQIGTLEWYTHIKNKGNTHLDQKPCFPKHLYYGLRSWRCKQSLSDRRLSYFSLVDKVSPNFAGLSYSLLRALNTVEILLTLQSTHSNFHQAE